MFAEPIDLIATTAAGRTWRVGKSPDDLDAMFTPDQQAALARGVAVLIDEFDGPTNYIVADHADA